MTARDHAVVGIGDKIRVDLGARSVYVSGMPVNPTLTPLEFEILVFFLSHPKQTIAQQSIGPLHDRLRAGYPAIHYLSKIRKKLGLGRNEFFKTIRKKGYRLEADVKELPQDFHSEASFLYKTAIHHFNIHTADSLQLSLDQSLEAINTHPNGDPRTLITLGYCYANLGHIAYCTMRPEDAMPLARQAAKAALDEDDSLARAHGLLGLVSLIYDFDWEAAKGEFEKALKLNPDEPVRFLLLRTS